jgi:hypothetical protein
MSLTEISKQHKKINEINDNNEIHYMLYKMKSCHNGLCFIYILVLRKATDLLFMVFHIRIFSDSIHVENLLV